MPKAPHREYTPEQKAEALKLYPKLGPAETARQLKIGRAAIQKWAAAAGLSLETKGPEYLERARNTAVLVTEERKLKLAADLLTKIERLNERFSESEVDHKGNLATRVEYDEITFASASKNADAISKLIDKVQLLTGQATARNETVNKEDMAKQVEAYFAGQADAYAEKVKSEQ